MDFFSVRDLRTSSKSIWESLAGDGEVVITTNGKPTALMLDISNKDLDEMLMAVKQAQAMIAVNNMRKKAASAGYMKDEDIEAEIKAAREDMA